VRKRNTERYYRLDPLVPDPEDPGFEPVLEPEDFEPIPELPVLEPGDPEPDGRSAELPPIPDEEPPIPDEPVELDAPDVLTPRAFAVWLSNCPVVCIFFAFWNSLNAWRVLGPITPSIGPGS